MEVLTPARLSEFDFQKHLQVPEQGNVTFPLVFTPDAASNLNTIKEATAWVSQHQDKLLELAKLHGAVLLRDFPIHNAQDFDAIGKAVGLEEFPYIGGAAPRRVSETYEYLC
jgi:hypothetical protein